MSITTTTPVSTSPTPNTVGVLGLSSTHSLIIGAVVDFVIGLLLAYLLGLVMYVPFGVKILLAFVVGVPLYLWSLNMHKKYPRCEVSEPEKSGNYIPPFQRGIVTRLGEVVPSGPDGNGLRPGYHWFPLGAPVYDIFKKQSVKMATIPFANMQVWTRNTASGKEGSIEGQTDGIAQFQIEDLAAYNAVKEPEQVLEAIVLESARDVCEDNTMEEFLGTANEVLADKILAEIHKKILKVPGNLGGHFVSVNVKKTDNRNEEVKKGHASINVERSLATSRKTDADARNERINGYKTAGVDANRAAALDAVVTGHSGATVGDQRYNVDVGETVGKIAEALTSKIPGGKP